MLPNDSKPGQVLFNGDGTKLAGTRIASSKIDSFTVGRDGRLTPAPARRSTPRRSRPPQGWGQLGSEFSPTSPDQLFVSDAHTAAGGAAFPGLVSSFIDGADGTLTPVGAPVANDGGASCWVEISHDGALPLRRQHRLGDGLQLLDRRRRHAHLPPEHGPGQIGAGAEDARLSPDGRTLWVVESGTNAVTGFSVSGGTLTPLVAIAGPAGATPSGIVVN